MVSPEARRALVYAHMEAEGRERRIRELEATLRALLPEDPTHDAYELRDGSWYKACAYCERREVSHILGLDHAEDCPWARARALVGEGEKE